MWFQITDRGSVETLDASEQNCQQAQLIAQTRGVVTGRFGRSSAILCWYPRLTSRTALVAAHRHLAGSPVLRTALRTYDQVWQDRLFPSVQMAFSHMAETAWQLKDAGFLFRSKRLRVDSLPQDHPFSVLSQFVSQCRQPVDDQEVLRCLQPMTRGRFIILQPLISLSRLSVRAWGDGYQSYNREWARSAPGHFYDDQPDQRFAKSASEAYYTVAATGEPWLDHVETSVWKPGRGTARTTYQRIILPVRSASSLLLLGAPCDSLIDVGSVKGLAERTNVID